VYSFFFYISKS